MGTIKNLDKINYRKRDAVKQGLLFIDSYNQNHVIDKVLVFGSALREDCRKQSDIDFCFITDYTTSNREYFYILGNMEQVTGNLCDIINYQMAKGALKDDIDNKGVIVYEY